MVADKQKFSAVIKCGHCANRAPMPIVADYSDTTSHEEGGIEWFQGTYYEVLQCPACRATTYRTYYYHSGYMDDDEAINYTYLYPVERAVPRGLPESLAKDYEAAQRVKNISANAYGVLLGRVLELMCVDRKAKGDSLYKQLQDLASRNEIPGALVGIADALRGFRNVGAHAGTELTPQEVPLLEDLTRAILEYVYSAPALVAAAVNQMDILKKRSAAP